MLRIHDRGVLRAEPEEASVEHLNALENRCCLDVARIVPQLGRDARTLQLLVGQLSNGLHTVVQVAPVFGNISGAWESSRHADHGDLVSGQARSVGPVHRIVVKVKWSLCFRHRPPSSAKAGQKRDAGR
jgi:hypothetical protein